MGPTHVERKKDMELVKKDFLEKMKARLLQDAVPEPKKKKKGKIDLSQPKPKKRKKEVKKDFFGQITQEFERAAGKSNLEAYLEEKFMNGEFNENDKYEVPELQLPIPDKDEKGNKLTTQIDHVLMAIDLVGY